MFPILSRKTVTLYLSICRVRSTQKAEHNSLPTYQHRLAVPLLIVVTSPHNTCPMVFMSKVMSVLKGRFAALAQTQLETT